MKVIVPADQEALKHLRFVSNNISSVVDFGCHRCTAQEYPGAARDVSMSSCTAD